MLIQVTKLFIWLSAHSDFARIKSSNVAFAVVLCQMTQFPEHLLALG